MARVSTSGAPTYPTIARFMKFARPSAVNSSAAVGSAMRRVASLRAMLRGRPATDGCCDRVPRKLF